MADDLWFRQMDHAENEQGRTVRKNMTSAEEDLMTMALRMKPHNNLWLYLSPRLCTLGEDAFKHAPAVIKEIHVYLKNLFDARELAGGMMLKLMQDVSTMSLDKFQADVLATRAQYERSDAILGEMGVGWTPSFLTAPKLDWGQSIGMVICVRRVVSMEPQVIVIAGSNDHLQSRGLLTRLTDGSIPSNEVIGVAIMTLLSAMAEVETAAKQRFNQNGVKVVFVLSPGYAALPKPLQFVYTMVTTISEGRFNVIIPAPNRVVDPNNYYPSRSELPAVWADISNAIQGLKDCSTTRLVLYEVLGLELSNFARLLKLRPGVDDDHLLVQQVADDLWFRQMDHAENEQGRTVRKNMTSAEEDLMTMALRMKPHNNLWLYLSPRLCTLGEDAFKHALAVIKEIHVYLKNLFDARELAGSMMLKLMQDVNTMSLDKFQADALATRAQYERSDAILGKMGVGWTPSFLSTCYPRASRNLVASFVKDIRKLSVGLILAL